MNDILEFRGPTRWLSNFHVESFEWRGKEYMTSEHAYQAAKACNDADHEYVRSASSPKEAMHRGRSIEQRADWDDIRVHVMYSVLKAKFAPDKLLALRLVETGECHLEEGNHHGDIFWGTVAGKGENYLGQVLMSVRQELMNSGVGSDRQ